MLNKVMLIGNLGKDPELKHVGETVVSNLRLATSRVWIDKASGEKREETEWHDVEVWGKQAEAVHNNMKKGSQLYVEGRLQADHWKSEGTDRSRTKIVADTVRFLGRKPTGPEAELAPPEEEAAA
jgi:single-strand DNA-binding protein